MNKNDDEIEKLNSLVNVGMFLETVSAMIVFSFEKNKTEIIQKLTDLMASFEKSLDEKEKEEFKKEMDSIIKKKADQIAEELDSKLTPEQVQEVLEQMNPDLKKDEPKDL